MDQGLGFRVHRTFSGSGFLVPDVVCLVSGLEMRGRSFDSRVSGFRFLVSGRELRYEGFGCRGSGFWSRVGR